MKASRILHKLGKGLMFIVIALLLLVCGVIVALYSPWSQRSLREAFLNRYGHTADGTEIAIADFSLGFPLHLQLKGLSVCQQGDTLIAANSFDASISPLSLLIGKATLDQATLKGVHYVLGGPDSAMYMILHADSIAIAPAVVKLSNMDISLSGAHIAGGRVDMTLGQDTVAKAPSEPTKMSINLENVVLEDFVYRMKMLPTIDTLSAYIGHAYLESGRIDMLSQTIQLSTLSGKHLDARYIAPDSATIAAFGPLPEATPSDSAAMPWTVTIDSIAFDHSHGLYTTADTSPLPGLDFAYISVDDLSLNIHDFYNQATIVRLPLEFSGTERCGVHLNASGNIDIDSTALNFTGFTLNTPDGTNASFSGKLGMGDMTSDPNLPMALWIESGFAPTDLMKMFPAFAPVLAGLPSNEPMRLDGRAEGTTGHLDLQDIRLHVNRCVTMTLDGWMGSFMDPTEMNGDIDIYGNIVNVNGIMQQMSATDEPSALTIPPMTLHGKLSMHSGVANGNIKAVTESGEVKMNGEWDSNHEDYFAQLTATDFPIQAFMPTLEIGATSAFLSVQGHGYNPFAETTALTADANIHSIQYRGATYNNVTASAHLNEGNADFNLESDNYEADITLTASGNLSGDIYDWKAFLNGRNIDLYALGFMPEPCTVEVNANLEAEVNLNQRDYNGHLILNDLYYRQLTGTIALSDIDALISANDSLTVAEILNRDMSASFTSPCAVDTLIGSFVASSDMLFKQMSNFSIRFDTISSTLPPFELKVKAGASNMINDILSASDMRLRQFSLDARNDSSLALDMAVTRFATATMTLDTLTITGRQYADTLNMKVGLRNRPGNLDQWHNVSLDASINPRTLQTRVTQQNLGGKTGFDIGMELGARAADTTFIMHFRPYDPIIGYQQWEVNDSNFLAFCLPRREVTGKLRMTGGNSSLAIFNEPTKIQTDSITDARRDDIVVQLGNIHVQDWISFNPWAPPMKGDVSADMRFNNWRGVLTANGSASITNFTYGRQRVADFKANLAMTASHGGGISADADLLVDGERTITIHGAMASSQDTTATSPLNLKLNMVRFPLTTVNPFLPTGTGRLSGTLYGDLDIHGTTDEPIANGYLSFDSTAVRLTMLGSDFTFCNDSIPVTNSVVHFNDFAIMGCNENPLTVGGTVDISNMNDINMDLTFKANNMQLVNTRRPSRGADVYGKAFINADASARGNMQFMSVDATLDVLPNTNMTYVMGETVSEIVNRSSDGMVKFVNFTDSLAINEPDSVASENMALLLNARLNIEDGSILAVDLNSDGTNKVQIESNAALDFNMTPMGSTRLTGRIDIENGFARYGMPPVLGEQLFTVETGSYVAFSGQMMNPTLNLKANNIVKANVTQSGANSRLVNFDVGLSVTGTLERMDVAFDLSTRDDITVANELESMSPEQRANQAMNLMLYRVYSGGDTKSNSSLSNPLYSFLAGQINSWAANNIKGVDVSFGIDQYDNTVDGSTSQSMSYSYQVSKTLFNDRFKIVVGGNYSTDANTDENFEQNLINDISFEYYLNNSRSMYLRLFRHTGYESILEGEITQTGVGFVYRRKIGRLGDMFLPPAMVKRREEKRRQQAESVEQSANEQK